MSHKKRYIFNKQYTKEQYKDIMLSITEKMREDEQGGEFFFTIMKSLFIRGWLHVRNAKKT